MRTHASAAALVAALTAAAVLAGCSDPGATPPADAPTSAEQAAADPGRGQRLTQVADRIEQRITLGLSQGSLTQDQAAQAVAELAEARRTLAEALTQSEGPLPQVDRQIVAARLGAIETMLDGAAR
jgi:hypothetical protein